MKEQIHGGDVYRHPGVLDYSSNVNLLGTPRSIIKAAQESMEKIDQYPDVCCSRLIEGIASYEGVSADKVICGSGAAELIFSLIMAIQPGKALVPAPTFAEYRQALAAVNALIIDWDMVDLRVGEDIFSALTSDIDFLVLCNPNNPTGFLIEKELLLRILDHCKKQDIFLLVDECFLDFVEEREENSLKGFLDTYRNLFLLKAFTKRYAMAGIRLGYGLSSNRALLDSMESKVQPWNVSLPAQAAGIQALQEEAYVKKARELVREERAWLKEKMAACGLEVFDSQANYIFFKGPDDLREACLGENILIRSCSNYRGLGPGYFRIAVRTREKNEILLAALEKIMSR